MLAAARICYHTLIKSLARDGGPSDNILKQIPRSNIYRWKSENPGKYKTFDLHMAISGDYEVIRAFSQNHSAKRIFVAYVRVAKTILSFAHGLDNFHQLVIFCIGLFTSFEFFLICYSDLLLPSESLNRRLCGDLKEPFFALLDSLIAKKKLKDNLSNLVAS